MDREDKEFLCENARDFGIELSLKHLNRFSLFIDELMEWNRRINLIGLSEPKRIISDLLLDSLIAALLTPDDGKMLDVGSGAGFPGIVVKIYRPDLIIHLLEASSKKAHFLKHIVRLLELKKIEVIKGRIERDKDKLCKEGYDFITARALAGLDQIKVWCAPFLSSNGQLIGFLGKDSETVLRKSKHSREAHSLALCKKMDYTLPGKSFQRSIVIFRKGVNQLISV